MNVYDFDGTIYDGDSSVDFYLFCIKRNPWIAIRCIPEHVAGGIGFALKRITRDRYKERFFSFLKYLDDYETLVREFWVHNNRKIKPWYLDSKNENDLVVSASPDFLLTPICNGLGIQLIATNIEPKTGRIIGRNCRGEEKVRRFNEKYPGETIESFYTDSFSDEPMMRIAQNSYMVKGDRVSQIYERLDDA